MMVVLLLYGYASGTFSSRKREKATHENVATMYLCAGLHPDHDRINAFRQRFLPELKMLFVEIRVIAKEMGALKMGTISLDGTKIKANARSKRLKLKIQGFKSMILSHIQKYDPTVSSESAAELIDIWEEVVDEIIKQMLDYCKAHIKDVHINLREEMVLELAKLRSLVSQKVVEDRLAGRAVSEIDIETERQQCFSEDGKDKIRNTGENCAKQIWISKYRERWEPKTKAALRKEENPKKTKLSPQKVKNNHFIPRSFIKKYWAEIQSVYKNVKCSDGTIETKPIPVGNWGFRKNLYSDRLEAYFGLLEGDAVRPIEMLLNVEPLNRPQREALIGFIVIQHLRNPCFMESLKNSVAPIVSVEVGEDKAKDDEYMKGLSVNG